MRAGDPRLAGAILGVGLAAVLVFAPSHLNGDPGCPASYDGRPVVVTGTVKFRVQLEGRWFSVIEDDERHRCVVRSESFVGNEGQWVWLSLVTVPGDDPYLMFSHER